MDTSALGLLVLPLPLLVLVAAVEGWLRQHRGLGHDWKAYWASLGDAAGRVLVNGLLKAGIVGALLYAVWQWRVATFAMNRWWHWVLLFVGLEFCYYWMHRADHRIHWFWLNHSVHHSSNQYTLSSAYRLGWTGKITGATVFFAPLVWVGFPVPVVLAALAVNLLYQFWLHTELIGRLPRPIEFVFNTPSHHRVHHASNPDYIDCNYGGVLIVFDRLFGSFRCEREDDPPRYGLVKPIYSHNPVRIAFHAWVHMLRNLKSARNWKERALVLFGPPQ
ncbi:sterol desaturase family protein [Luteibacter sp. Lutesp34]|uniref:sterol desaturase family protein n=1 Tax=Luteibacter sp. Lutesp34 TaxID=3243030 RepID=UPI0039B42A1A